MITPVPERDGETASERRSWPHVFSCADKREDLDDDRLVVIGWGLGGRQLQVRPGQLEAREAKGAKKPWATIRRGWMLRRGTMLAGRYLLYGMHLLYIRCSR